MKRASAAYANTLLHALPTFQGCNRSCQIVRCMSLIKYTAVVWCYLKEGRVLVKYFNRNRYDY